MAKLPNFVKKDIDKYAAIASAQRKNFVKPSAKVETKPASKPVAKPKGEQQQ